MPTLVEYRFDINGLVELDKISGEIIRLLNGPCGVAMSGEMGAGKTTLINALCRQLGVVDQVSSPTFTLLNEYSTYDAVPVYHIDCYRLRNETEAVEAGLDEYLDTSCWCFIEWPEKIPNLLPVNCVQMRIGANNDRRSIIIFK